MDCPLDKEWRPYYEELDPHKRFALLERLEGESAQDGQSFRRELFKARYERRSKPERIADLWLWKCVYLPGLFRRRKLLKKAAKSELLGTLEELRLRRELSFEERCILYWEFRNTVRRYLSTCQGPRYGRSLFGLKKATPEEQKLRAGEDVWKMSRGIARSAQLEEALSLWCEACRDEVGAYDEAAAQHFDELDRDFER
ncbi:MAG: hypothetical protein IJ228_03270 [Succinivibrio sp.]|nr:hypothetical protein [Succinivibrio sp.]